jgi:hypothetical protein
MRILDDLTTRKGLFAEAHMASLNSLPIEQLVVRFALLSFLPLTSLAGHKYHSAERAQRTVFEANSTGHQLYHRRKHTSYAQRRKYQPPVW